MPAEIPWTSSLPAGDPLHINLEGFAQVVAAIEAIARIDDCGGHRQRSRFDNRQDLFKVFRQEFILGMDARFRDLEVPIKVQERDIRNVLCRPPPPMGTMLIHTWIEIGTRASCQFIHV